VVGQNAANGLNRRAQSAAPGVKDRGGHASGAHGRLARPWRWAGVAVLVVVALVAIGQSVGMAMDMTNWSARRHDSGQSGGERGTIMGSDRSVGAKNTVGPHRPGIRTANRVEALVAGNSVEALAEACGAACAPGMGPYVANSAGALPGAEGMIWSAASIEVAAVPAGGRSKRKKEGRTRAGEGAGRRRAALESHRAR